MDSKVPTFQMRREAQLREEKMHKLFKERRECFKEVGTWSVVQLDEARERIVKVLEEGPLFGYVPVDEDCEEGGQDDTVN